MASGCNSITSRQPFFRFASGQKCPIGPMSTFSFSAALMRPGKVVSGMSASVEQVLLAASLYWALAANRPFFAAALAGRSALDMGSWAYGLALSMLLVAVHLLLLSPLVNRWTIKPVLALLTVMTALASYFMQHYGIYMDPAMLRNVLSSDALEARELLSWPMVFHVLLYAALPLVFLWRVRIVHRHWSKALMRRTALMALAAAAAMGAVLAVFQPFSSLMRNHKEVRYLITPANYLWSLASVAASDVHGATAPRRAIGLDAAPGLSWATRTRPAVLILVVGETARSANWGLNQYRRQTTPELATWPVFNFRDVRACGTSTEVSLPCMFAPVGRRRYDESAIRESESLLHVLARGGASVLWRDNQSGCKGVCDGLPHETAMSKDAPGLCPHERCLDDALLAGLDDRLKHARGTQVLVLHQLGNHGPSYFRRYPASFERFRPACHDDDLQHCTREQIVNAYDNALLYTDHLLGSLLSRLKDHEDKVDSALIYVSDHGESLGESNLYLHGMPYAIAPREQTQVPMVMWMSSGLQQAQGIDSACLQQRTALPASHDHLFHTVLGLLDVRTHLYEPELDLVAQCRHTNRQAAL